MHDRLEDSNTVEKIRSCIRTIPDFPKKGILFRDITTLLKDREGFAVTMQALKQKYHYVGIDKVAGIESRGFIFGAALAMSLGCGFVPIRKKGKLPGNTINQQYALEYGADQVEVHTDAITAGERVLLVDDLIATGGTALASCRLIEELGGRLEGCAFVIDLPDLGGSARLVQEGYRVFTMVEFEGE